MGKLKVGQIWEHSSIKDLNYKVVKHETGDLYCFKRVDSHELKNNNYNIYFACTYATLMKFMNPKPVTNNTFLQNFK